MSTDQHNDTKHSKQGRRRSATPLRTRLAAACTSALTVVLVLLGAAAPAAQAAGFIPVSICRTADGQPAISPDVRFNISDPGGISADVAEDRCAQGGALELSMGAGSAHDGNLSLGIDGPGTYPSDKNANFFNVVMWRSVILDASSNAAAYYQLQTGMGSGYGFEQCGTQQQCSSRGSESAAPLSDTNRYALTADGTDGHGYVQVNTGCSVPNNSPTYDPPYSFPCPATTGPRIRTRIYRIAFNAADPTPPVFNGAPAGPLNNPGATVKGTQTISYSAGDPSSSRSGAGGVWKAEILVDGQSQASQIADANGGVCKMLGDGSFASATPCKRSVENAAVSLDTLRFANGTHTISIRLTDAASNITTSASSTVTIANPATNTAKPTLVATGTGSLAAPKKGDTLGSTLGSWAPDGAELKRQWLRCDQQANACAAIGGATAETYKLTSDDAGQTVRLRVDASNPVGSSSAQSDPTGVITATPPEGTGTTTIVGDGGKDPSQPRVGDTLTIKAPGYPTGTAVAFQWLRCDGNGRECAAIRDATNANYTVVDADKDRRLIGQVTATSTSGQASSRSEPTGVVTSGAAGTPGGPVKDPVSGGGPGGPGGPGDLLKLADGAFNGAGACRDAKLTARFVSGTKITVRFGRAATLRGKLICGPTGRAIGGARIALGARTFGRTLYAPAGVITTAQDGTFTRVLARGPGRQLALSYTAVGGDATPAATAGARMHVRGKITLKALAPRVKRGGGGRIVVRGRVHVSKGQIPGGFRLLLQAQDGRRWRLADPIKVKADGRFTHVYRCACKTAGALYRFRVAIPGGTRLPYTTAHSRSYKVRVR